MPMFDELRAELRKYRAQKGLYQAHIADVLEVDQSTISAFETGAKSLGPDKIEKLMEILDLRLIPGFAQAPGQAPPLIREAAVPYGRPVREVPIPSSRQIELLLDTARRLGDKETIKALQEMQMQILAIIEQLEPIGDAFTKHIKALEQLKHEAQHRPKDAIDY